MKAVQDKYKEALTEQAWKELIQAIKPRDISVSVENGTVTLGGTVESYARKLLAAQIVSGLTGVKDIINTIEVKLPGIHRKKDDELTDTILDAFIRHLSETNDPLPAGNDWLAFQGEMAIPAGGRIPVKGKMCPVSETRPGKPAKVSHPAIITTEELAYWEVFG